LACHGTNEADYATTFTSDLPALEYALCLPHFLKRALFQQPVPNYLIECDDAIISARPLSHVIIHFGNINMHCVCA
jgi:hypothetical protein